MLSGLGNSAVYAGPLGKPSNVPSVPQHRLHSAVVVIYLGFDSSRGTWLLAALCKSGVLVVFAAEISFLGQDHLWALIRNTKLAYSFAWENSVQHFLLP